MENHATVPGFTQSSFDYLKRKTQEKKPLLVNVVFDEMSIKKYIEYYNGKFHGCVDFGVEGTKEDMSAPAKDVLVFMVVGLDEPWKLPLGYFFLSKLGAKG